MTSEMQTCRSCPELGQQSLENFSKYKNGIKVFHRKQCKKCRSKEESLKYKESETRQIQAKKNSLKSHLKRSYNLSVDEYQNLLNLQNGECAICKQVSDKTLNIDHCHKTGKIRGLICWNCNMGIGYFKDNADFLINAAKYLNEENL